MRSVFTEVHLGTCLVFDGFRGEGNGGMAIDEGSSNLGMSASALMVFLKRRALRMSASACARVKGFCSHPRRPSRSGHLLPEVTRPFLITFL